MNPRTICLFLLLLLTTYIPSFAAYPVRKPVSAATTVFHRLQHDDRTTAPERRKYDNGKLSFIFGLASLITMGVGGGIFLGIPAIILGNAGIRKHEEHAKGGKKMGTVSLVISGFFALVFLLYIGSYML